MSAQALPRPSTMTLRMETSWPLAIVPMILPDGASLRFNGVPVGSITLQRDCAKASEAQKHAAMTSAAETIDLMIVPSCRRGSQGVDPYGNPLAWGAFSLRINLSPLRQFGIAEGYGRPFDLRDLSIVRFGENGGARQSKRRARRREFRVVQRGKQGDAHRRGKGLAEFRVDHERQAGRDLRPGDRHDIIEKLGALATEQRESDAIDRRKIGFARRNGGNARGVRASDDDFAEHRPAACDRRDEATKEIHA